MTVKLGEGAMAPPGAPGSAAAGTGYTGTLPPAPSGQAVPGGPTAWEGRAVRHPIRWLKDYLPRGNMLDRETFSQRHLFLCWLLGLHLPALFVFGLWRGFGAAGLVLELAAPAACLLLARLIRPGRLAAFFLTAGLVACSAVLVHLSGGMIEAHFHFFILIGFIALYQDWVPFLWNVTFVVLSHGLGSAVAADLMFDHHAAQHKPWTWAAIHGVSVLAACTGVVIYWRHTERVQWRNIALRDQLAGAELAAATAEVSRRRSVSTLLIHLARRNQSLLDRQLHLIGDLEQREREPEPLADLFRLDHLATRMRRNAESLLVLSGDEPSRRWGRPVALGDVVRAAAAEVEAYQRVEVLVNEHLEVEGRVVADMTHLLAELIENATVFSAPGSEVRVQSYLVPVEGSSAFVISIEDRGIGMAPEDLRQANEILASTPEIDLTWQTLGFHVVSRLARRLGLEVRLADTPGGGVTALVTVPRVLLVERSPGQAVRPRAELKAGAPVGDAGHEGGGWSPAPPGPAAYAHLSGAGTGRAPEQVGGAGNAGVGRVSGEPVAHGRAAPGPVAGRPAGGEVTDVTDEGLVRRVPGANLAAAERSTPFLHAGSDRTGQGVSRESSPSMLSRFQASQRAGRMAATEQVGRPAGETTDGDGGDRPDEPRDE